MNRRYWIGLLAIAAFASVLIAFWIFFDKTNRSGSERGGNGATKEITSLSSDMGEDKGPDITTGPESQDNELHVFRVGTTKFPVVIEDGEFGEKLISTVLQELNTQYSQLDMIHIGNRTVFSRKFEIGGRTLEAKRFIYRDASATFYLPKGYLDNFGDLVELNSKDHIVITKNLLHEYEKGMEFKRHHENELQRLDEFLQYVNGLDSVDDLTDGQIRGLFYLGGSEELEKVLTPQLLRENAEGFVKNYHIQYPSILDFAEGEFAGEKVIFVGTLFFKKGTGIVWNKLPLAYVGSEWRIIFIAGGA